MMNGSVSESLDRHAAESKLFALIEQMESLAESADWDEVEAIAIQLRFVVMDIPPANRRMALLALQRTVNKVADGARAAHQAVSAKLTDLSRGKAAKKAYELR